MRPVEAFLQRQMGHAGFGDGAVLVLFAGRYPDRVAGPDLADRLINFVSALIGFVRGGLAMVNIGVSLFFAEISGSAVADVAALGPVLIPQMKKRGYSAPLSAAVTSFSASLRAYHFVVTRR